MYVQDEGVKDKNGGWGVIVSIFQQVGVRGVDVYLDV